MKTARPVLAILTTLALAPGLLTLACTRGNPAFKLEERPPTGTPDPERVHDGGGREDAPWGAERPPADPPLAPDAPAEAAPPDAPLDASAETEPADGPALDAADAASDAALPDSSLAVGLVARYPLDPAAGTAVRDDTLSFTGARYGGSAWTASGFPGAQFPNPGALVLDGLTGYATLPVTGLPGIGAAKSVSLWFWQPGPASGLRRTLLSLSNPDLEQGVQLGLQSGVPSVWIWAQLIGTAIVAADQASPAGWTHLAYVYQGGMHALYLNGVLADTRNAVLRAAPATSFMLGGYSAGLGFDERFSGRLDDVRVWGRALTAAEIRALAAGAR